MLRRTRRLSRRPPAAAVVLLVAQVAAAVGLPVYAVKPAACGCHTSGECGGSACGCRGGVPAGCGACGKPIGECCCSTSLAKPKHDCCSTHRPADGPRVQWVVAFAAKSCKQRGPLGLPAAEPAV